MLAGLRTLADDPRYMLRMRMMRAAQRPAVRLPARPNNPQQLQNPQFPAPAVHSAWMRLPQQIRPTAQSQVQGQPQVQPQGQSLWRSLMTSPPAPTPIQAKHIARALCMLEPPVERVL